MGTKTVSVAATNYMQFLNMTGVFDFVLPSLSTSLLDLKIDANKGSYGLAGSSSKSGGFGGALFLKFLNNSTQGIVEEGVSIYSGDRGGFDMYVEEAILSFAFTQSGTSAGQYGIAGTFAFNQQDSDTLAYIGSGVNITGQSVSLYSGSRSTHINWAGSVATGSNLGFGATVSINDLNRNTGAIIGAIPADTGSSEAGEQPFGLPTGLNYTTPADLATSRTNIDVAGDISIDTLADGQNWAFSVAAAVVRDKATTAQVGDGSGVATDDALDGKSLPAAAGAGDNKAIANDQGQQGKFGIGISGDVSLNTLTENVYGFIFDAGVIHGNRFDIASMNETEVRSLSGAAAFVSSKNSTSGGLAGSFSSIELNGETKAFIASVALNDLPGLDVDATDVSVMAERTGDIFAISAGGTGAPRQNSVAIAGSVALNTINQQTTAYLEQVDLTAELIEVMADDDSDIRAIGGAISFGGKGGFGAAIAVNRIDSDATAEVLSSTLFHTDDLLVAATNDADIRAITASLGAATKGVGGAGTVSVNIIDSDATAQIVDSTNRDQASLGNIIVKAKDDSQIQSLAGAIGIGKNWRLRRGGGLQRHHQRCPGDH